MATKVEHLSGIGPILIGVIWSVVILHFWRPLALLPALVEVWSGKLVSALLGKGFFSSIIEIPLSFLPILVVLLVWVPLGLGGPYFVFTGVKILLTGTGPGTKENKEKDSQA